MPSVTAVQASNQIQQAVYTFVSFLEMKVGNITVGRAVLLVLTM